MKKAKVLLHIALIASLSAGFTACEEQGWTPLREGASERAPAHSAVGESAADAGQSSQAEEKEEPDDSPVLWENGQRYLYVFQPETNNYRRVRAIENDGTLTMKKLLDLVSAELGVKPQAQSLYFKPNPSAGADGDASWPVVDLAGEFIDGALAGAGDEARFLNSVSASMRDQHLVNAKITFLRDGGPYRSAHLSFGAEEAYPQPAISLGTLTPEAYAALRATAPYSGMSDMYMGDYYKIILEPPHQEHGKEFVQLLMRVGDPGRNIASPADFSNQELLWMGIESAQMQYVDDDSSPLQPIVDSVEDFEFTLREHVERAIEDIFGQKLVLRHQDVGYFRWHENEGVYTPPHIGGVEHPLPVIYTCEEKADRYILTVGYITQSLGYIEEEHWNEYVAELREYALSEAPRREVVLLRQPDGAVTFYSHRYL